MFLLIAVIAVLTVYVASIATLVWWGRKQHATAPLLNDPYPLVDQRKHPRATPLHEDSLGQASTWGDYGRGRP